MIDLFTCTNGHHSPELTSHMIYSMMHTDIQSNKFEMAARDKCIPFIVLHPLYA